MPNKENPDWKPEPRDDATRGTRGRDTQSAGSYELNGHRGGKIAREAGAGPIGNEADPLLTPDAPAPDPAPAASADDAVHGRYGAGGEYTATGVTGADRQDYHEQRHPDPQTEGEALRTPARRGT